MFGGRLDNGDIQMRRGLLDRDSGGKADITPAHNQHVQHRAAPVPYASDVTYIDHRNFTSYRWETWK